MLAGARRIAFAAVLAASVAVPLAAQVALQAPAGAQGVCTAPIWSTSNPSGSYNLLNRKGIPGASWANNNEWGNPNVPQTISVCSKKSWTVTSQATDDGGAIQTYPDTEYVVGGRDTGSTVSSSTTPLSAYTKITSTFAEQFPEGDSANDYDAAYDMWTNNFGGDGGHEIMVQNQLSGSADYWYTCASEYVPVTNPEPCGRPEISFTVSGVAYWGLGEPNGSNLIVNFPQTQVQSGTVNILGVMDADAAAGWMSTSEVPTQLEYGVEIAGTDGTQGFPLTGLTFSLSS